MSRIIELIFALAAAVLAMDAGIVAGKIIIFECFPWLHSIELSKWGPSDWAAWVQAFGSVGAILGAIWIANTETRRRKRDAQALAHVTIAAISLRVVRVADVMQMVFDTVNDDFRRGYGINYGQLASDLRNEKLWTIEEIIPLIVLPNNVASNLSACRIQIQDIISKLDKLGVDVTFNRTHDPIEEAALIECLNYPNETLSAICREFVVYMGRAHQ
jgi:hypothetical protein